MPPPRTTSPAPTPTPTNHLYFDPWSTSSTGHQVGDSAQSKAYRTLRQEKLARQFGEGRGDCTWSEGKSGVLERGAWVEEVGGDCKKGGGARGMGRDSRQRDIRGMFGVSKLGTATTATTQGQQQGKKDAQEKKEELEDTSDNNSIIITTTKDTSIVSPEPEPQPQSTIHLPPKDEYPQIFTTLTIYINAPSHPLLSDHKLKHILTLHGATVSLSLSRRVTHVIVGRPNTRLGSGGGASGAGGGLAGGKLQREIARAGWKGWKVVFVEWYVSLSSFSSSFHIMLF